MRTANNATGHQSDISHFDGDEDINNADGAKSTNLLGALAGTLAGTTQPTINTVVIFDQKSYDNMLFKTAGVVLVMLIIWAFARYYSNGNVA